MDGRPNRRKKAAFSNSSGAVCAGSILLWHEEMSYFLPVENIFCSI